MKIVTMNSNNDSKYLEYTPKSHEVIVHFVYITVAYISLNAIWMFNEIAPTPNQYESVSATKVLLKAWL